jgi:hypothetical protein
VTFPSIYIRIIPWIGSSLHYSPSCPTSPLMVTSTGFNVPYSFLHRKYISHIHPFSLFIYPPPSSDLLLAQPVLHSYPPLFKCLLVVQWEFCLGILPVNIFFYSQSNPPPLLFLTLPSHPVLLKNFSVSSSCSYICISVLFTIFISFCPSHLASSDSPTFRNMFCIYLYVC